MPKKQNLGADSEWERLRKEFHLLLSKVSSSYDTITIFNDACRMFAISLRSPLVLSKDEKEAIEQEYKALADKYGVEGTEKISGLFALVMQALEIKRGDFLGHIYEDLNATKKGFGQFFTPDSVAKLMARIAFPPDSIEQGRIVKICDPTCGAGALLIEAAESFIESGGRQGDLLLYADDLDGTACNIAYTQFSLLGYPAIVRRMDSLAMEVFEGPLYTFGYFGHAMPMRLHKTQGSPEKKEDFFPETETISEEPKEGAVEEPPINVRELAQGEFNFGFNFGGEN